MSYTAASPTAKPQWAATSEPPTTLKLLVIGQPFSPRLRASLRATRNGRTLLYMIRGRKGLAGWEGGGACLGDQPEARWWGVKRA